MLKCKTCGAVFPDDALRPSRHIPYPYGEEPPEAPGLPCGHDDYDFCVGNCLYCGVDMLGPDESDVEGMCKGCFGASVEYIDDLVKKQGDKKDMNVWKVLKEGAW